MNNTKYSLDCLECGDSAIVAGLDTLGAKRRRLLDLGMVEGTPIECLFRSPHNDPTAYCIRGCVIALRAVDAKKISIKKQSN